MTGTSITDPQAYRSTFPSDGAVIRFSVGGGNPAVADGARGVNRGLSFRIDGDGPGQTEFVMVNAPINFVASPAQMLGFLQARRPAAALGDEGKHVGDHLCDQLGCHAMSLRKSSRRR